MPDAVGHELVEAEAEFRGAFGDRVEEFRVQKRLAAGEAERFDSGFVSLFEESYRGGDIEPVGPFNRHAAMWARKIALVRSGKREVVWPERARAAFGGAIFAQRALGRKVDRWWAVACGSTSSLLQGQENSSRLVGLVG